MRLRIVVTYNGKLIAEQEHLVRAEAESWTIPIPIGNYDTAYWWSPEIPNLIDVGFTLIADGQPVDEAACYFGMRKVSIEKGKLCLNNRPYFLKMGGLREETARGDSTAASFRDFSGLLFHAAYRRGTGDQRFADV